MNPLAKTFIFSQGAADLQSKGSGIGVDETGCDPSVSTVSVYEVQIWLPHFPGLLNDLFEYTAPHDLGWVVSM